jgi:hypothetical protein
MVKEEVDLVMYNSSSDTRPKQRKVRRKVELIPVPVTTPLIKNQRRRRKTQKR